MHANLHETAEVTAVLMFCL